MLCSLHQAMIPKTKDSFSLLENLPRDERATETSKAVLNLLLMSTKQRSQDPKDRRFNSLF